MVIIKLKPITPGQRNKTKILKENIFKGKPIKKLCKTLNYKSGRNNTGRITVRHKGGRIKRLYRIIDFKRDKLNIYAKILRIEYDPNRSANIALICYENGIKNYIIYPKDLILNDKIISDISCPIKIGNSLLLKNIPNGTKIHCVENYPGSGAKISRSAGTYCTVLSKDKNTVSVSLKSDKIIKLNCECRATIGEVGNESYNLVNIGKAGINRLKGIRPTVRGVAMNPIDHPHGGGEGKTSGGRDPVTPWGFPTKGYITKK